MSFDPQWGAPAQPIAVTPAPPARHRRTRWVAIVATVVGLVGLGAIGYLVFGRGSDKPVGASSPEAAVTGVANALDAEDSLAALQFVAPDEIAGVTDLVETVQQVAHDDVADVTKGGDAKLGVTLTEVRSTKLAKDAARVSFRILGTFSASGRLAELLGGAEHAVDRSDFSVIAVRLDGGWFVSPLLTAGDLAVDQLDLPSGNFQRISQKTARAKSAQPTDAVESLLHGVADLDPDEVAASLSSGEARLVNVYSDAIDDLLERARDQMARSSTTLSLGSIDALQLDGGRVALNKVALDIDNVNGSTKLEFSDDCVAVTSDGSRDRACALTNAPLTSPLPDSRVVLDTVKEDGGYRVDLVKSFSSLAEDVLVRLDRPTVLEALGLEVVDTPTEMAFNSNQQVTFAGEPFKVFETTVPAHTRFGFDAEAVDSSDDESGDVSSRTYVLRDGRWRSYYGGDEDSTGFDAPTQVRIVVRPDCSGSSDGALLFRCARRSTPTVTVTAIADVDADVPFLGSGAIDVQPLQTVRFHFTADHAGDVAVLATSATGGPEYISLEPYAAANGDGSFQLVAGDYTATYRNDGPTVVNVTLSFKEAAVSHLRTATNLSRGNPTTTFDLAAGATADFQAYAEAGDSVVISVSPSGNDDLVLIVRSSSGNICDASSGGDRGGTGDNESCSFTVSSGGNFGVEVTGSSSSSAAQGVTATLDLS